MPAWRPPGGRVRQGFASRSTAPRPPADPTAGGGAYHGAFLFALLGGRPLEDAAALASAAAALNAQHLGARQGLATLEEAETVLPSPPPPHPAARWKPSRPIAYVLTPGGASGSSDSERTGTSRGESPCLLGRRFWEPSCA